MSQVRDLIIDDYNDVLFLRNEIICRSSVKIKSLKRTRNLARQLHICIYGIRMNGHRDKFIIDVRLKLEQSALSMQCFLKHKNDFNMGDF